MFGLNLFGSRREKQKFSGSGLNTPLLELGKAEPFTIGDSFEGVCILGGSGSGKTTASGWGLSAAMLEHGYGGLVLTAKIEEVERWKRLAVEANRSHDLMVFEEANGSEFNFLDYLGKRMAADVGISGTLIYLLEELAEVIERMSGLHASRGDEQFFAQGRRELVSHAIDLCLLTVGTVSIPHISEIIRDAPRSLDETRSLAWQASSVTHLLLKEIDRSNMSEGAREDLSQVEAYFMQSFPRLADKTRSCIEAGTSGTLQLFTKGMLKRLFCKGTTITPDEIIRDGKIIVINLPIKKYLGLGLVAQTIWKTAFQQRAEQRSPTEQRPCFLYIDEAQTLLSRRDAEFAATARSSRVCNLWLTQNLANLYMVTGADESGKAAADSLLGMAMTKIFHANSCPITAQWASDLIGKRKIRLRSSSINHPTSNGSLFFPELPQVTSSSAETFEYIVHPYEFSMLRKAGMPHRSAEAIVYQSGRRWRSTGESFCRIDFPQGF